MLNRYAKTFFNRLLRPLARALLARGIHADWVSIVGTIGVVVGALAFYPLGELFWGTLFITLFIFSDVLDGLMAREAGCSSAWGSFLDSSLDRVQDAAIFIGIIWWFFTGGNNPAIAIAALACMGLGFLVSYVRAKAEALGFEAAVGIAERPERMVATLVFTGFTGLGLAQPVLLIVLILLAIASAITVYQRMRTVHAQATAATDTTKSA
ncbi:phosphatidylinositol phosphate synthase [Micrococcoides hystricis]|uniref:Phosphatidylinositol phosphate synthase n=1 Tax=Micrococcoides hystricis TaxID=1572761 RepID=A0ABV6P7K1_9MICC